MNGKLYVHCNSCRKSATRPQDLSNPEELPPDEIVHETVPEGVRIDRTDPDEFHTEYDDDIPEDLPDDLAVSAKGLHCIKKFLIALKAFKREVCPTCSEIDWQMRLKDDKCHRCRADKRDVRKFCIENKTNPCGYSSLCGRNN
jgi:hypothetical protein